MSRFWSTILAVFLISSTCCADPFLGEVYQRDLTVSQRENLLITLSDSSVWEIKPLTEKSHQSWSDWWNNITPIDWKFSDDYFFSPSIWEGRRGVQVHRTIGPYPIYRYLLVDPISGHKSFAKYIPFGSLTAAQIADITAKKGTIFTESTVMAVVPSMHDVIVLNDHTVWRINEEVGSNQQFQSNLSNWNPDDKIRVLETKIDDSIAEKYHFNQTSIHIYLIENHNLNASSFATPIAQKDFLKKLEYRCKNRIQDSYKKGFSHGLEDQHNFFYAKGRRKGYRDGYDVGRFHGLNNKSEVFYHNEYYRQYPEPPQPREYFLGESEGIIVANPIDLKDHLEILERNTQSQINHAYQIGRENGSLFAEEKGYNQGRRDGYKKGYRDGYKEGRSAFLRTEDYR